jgi:hypothetical protein
LSQRVANHHKQFQRVTAAPGKSVRQVCEMARDLAAGSGQLGTAQKMRAAAKADRDETGRQTYFLENETVEMEMRAATQLAIPEPG